MYNDNTQNIVILMKRKELTLTFMMISNWEKKYWTPWFIQKYFSVVRVNTIELSYSIVQPIVLTLPDRHIKNC